MIKEKKHLPQRSISQEKGSNLSKYMQRAAGTRSFVQFFRYELYTTFFGGISGAVGLLLRKLFYPGLFGACNGCVVFGRQCTIRHPKKIHIGDGTFIDDFCVLDSKSDVDPGIAIGTRCIIARNSKISTGYSGYVKIGNDSIVGENCIVHGPGGIKIGNKVLLGDFCVLNAGLHIYTDPKKPLLDQGITVQGIDVGDDVWIGGGSTVLDGVTIGAGAIIKPGTLVDSDVASGQIVSGNPMKVEGLRK